MYGVQLEKTAWKGKEQMNLKKSIRCLVNVLMILFWACLVFLSSPNLAGLQCYVVISGSMEPALPVGSAVYVREKDPGRIKEGEIITYTTNAKKTRVTHRVCEVNRKERTFLTKGDANERADQNPVPWENVCGSVKFEIPYAGYLLKFLDTWKGKTAVIFLGVALYLCSECLKDCKTNTVS